jgi:predicted component of type VI protein secretion system
MKRISASEIIQQVNRINRAVRGARSKFEPRLVHKTE